MDLQREQHFNDGTVVVGDVLRTLRARFRELCGLPPLPDDSEVTGAETTAVFVLCYLAFNGRSASREVRMARVLRDVDEFIKGQGELSYSVLYVHHHLREILLEESQISADYRDFFKQASEMRGETPIEADDLKFPNSLFLRAPAT